MNLKLTSQKSVLLIVASFNFFFLFGQDILTNQSREYLFPNGIEKQNEFDFWVGKWAVDLSVIKDSTWAKEHNASVNVYSILKGKAVLELWKEIGTSDDKNIIGFSLRYYNFLNNEWDLWLKWPTPGRSVIGKLSGNFQHGRGEFKSKFVNSENKNAIARYTFSDISPNSLRWDDSFSSDGGITWTNNWIMNFSRVSNVPDSVNINKGIAHTYQLGNKCTSDEFRVMESLSGQKKGHIKIIEKDEVISNSDLSIESYKILGGCAVMSFYRYKDLKGNELESFMLSSFNTNRKKYEYLLLDNKKEANALLFFGDKKDGIISAKNNEKNMTITSNKNNLEIQIKDTNNKSSVIYRIDQN